MKISIDTKEDSHEEIKKVIKMLQNLVGGENQEIFTNQPDLSSSEASTSPMANIFGDALSSSETIETQSTGASETSEPKESSQSTEDLFAELFSEEEIKKMEPIKAPEDEEEEVELKPKKNRYDIEFY